MPNETAVPVAETAIEAAARHAGGQSALARLLDVKPQAVQQWVKRGKCPSERAIAIETKLERKVTRYQLCPETFGSAP